MDSLQPQKSERPVNMESLLVNNNNGQSYGYTLYETAVSRGGTLNARNNVRDRALVRHTTTDTTTETQLTHND